MISQDASSEGDAGQRNARRRRWLLGCGIALAILLVLVTAGWLVVNRYLGDILASLVRERAAASINGRLEFERLEIDLAGRAVLTDAAVYETHSELALLSCPRTVVGFDLINFIGPNRGRRAVTVTLYEPRILLVREPDGRFNLQRLQKEQVEPSEPIGVSLQLRRATVDFTDWCLLDQDYPQLEADGGLARQLLDELGYDPRGPAETQSHHERLTLGGSIVVNGERGELALDLVLTREDGGGRVTAAGTAASDGTSFDLRLGLTDVGLASARDYIQAAFPRLTLVDSPAAGAAPPTPSLAGRIQQAALRLRRQPGPSQLIGGQVRLADTRLVSSLLPVLDLPRLSAQLDEDSGRLTLDLQLLTVGCELTGRPRIELNDRTLAGQLKAVCDDLAVAASELGAADLPLTGSAAAEIALSGTLDDPRLKATLGGGPLKYGELSLGRPRGEVLLAGTQVTLAGVELSGGEAALRLSGALDLRVMSGELEVSAGTMPAAEAVALASRISGAEPPELDLSGSLSAAAAIRLSDGEPAISLRTWSKELLVNGQRLSPVDVKAAVEPPSVRLTAAEATLWTAEPLSLAGFTSDGPLKLLVRAGGTISQLPEQQVAALAIVGEANTLNLSPAQAEISFKIIGPADDPELRGQLKTKHADSPLLLRAKGRYREGYAPWTASLTWQQSTAEFSGELDLPGQRMRGKVTASDVDLGRFSGDQRLAGTLSAEATVGGTFSAPTVSGQLSAPLITVLLPHRSYAIADLAAGFKLAEGQAISIAGGGFSFEGSPFTARGVLGREGSELTLESPRFDLFSAVAQAPVARPGTGKTAEIRPPLEISSAGPLTVRLSGELADPLAVIDYSSGAGIVEGHAFSSAALSATADLKRAEVRSLTVVSPDGQLSVSGSATYEPLAYSADAAIEHFDVAVLTALAGGGVLGKLRGYLDGQVRFSGDAEGYSADGSLALSEGSFNQVAISSTSVQLRTSGAAVEIVNGRVVAEGTTLTASGTIGPELADTRISIDAQPLNLALLAPLLPAAVPALGGSVSGEAQLSPGRGQYPELDLELTGAAGGLSVGHLQLTGISAKAAIRRDLLTIQRLELATAGSKLAASGKLDLADLPAQSQAVGKLPLELELDFENLSLSDAREFVPEQYRAQWPTGTITGRLSSRPGRGSYPDVDVNLASTAGGLTVGGVKFESVDAQATLRRDQLQVTRLVLASGSTSLDLSAKLDLAMFAEAGGEARPLPLDVSLNSSAFNLADLATFLPPAQRGLLPGGTLTCKNVRLTGTTADPRLSGEASFDLVDLPAAADFIARAAGAVRFSDNMFDIQRVDLTPTGAVQGQAQLVGSGTLSLSPVGLVDGQVDLILAPAGQPYLQVDTSEVSSPLLAGKYFRGQVGGVLHIAASERQADKAKRDFTPVISGQVSITADGQASELTIYHMAEEEGESQAAPFRFAGEDEGGGLRVTINPTTTFDYRPAVDLKVELAGDLTLYGTPGLLDRSDPDAFKICGTLEIPRGSMRVYRHVVRIEGERSRITFACLPGDIYPYLTARGALELPRVLSGSQPTTAGAQLGAISAGRDRGDLLVYFTFANHKLDPTADHSEAVSLSSEPPLPPDQILTYLLGGAADVLTGQGDLAQFAQGELFAFGSSFISREIEETFDLQAFRLGGSGSEDNPFWVDVEKAITPDFSVTYYRNFYGETQQTEEYGVRYMILRDRDKDMYQNLELQVNFSQDAFRGTGSEFMFVWSTRF